MEKAATKRININLVVISSLFFILQRVLLSVTKAPAYTTDPERYLVYHALLLIVSAGMNLIPLYIGFHWADWKKKNPLKYLGKFFFVYLWVILIGIVTIFWLTRAIDIRDIWRTLFPISENYFPYAVSVVLSVLVGAYLFRHLDQQSDAVVKKLLAVTSILFVVLPTLFGKDIFLYNSGKSLIWVMFVTLIGYMIQRFRDQIKIKQPFILLVASVLILILLMFIMIEVSDILWANTSTANRFSTPYSIFGFAYSLLLFYWIETRLNRVVKLNVTFKTFANIAIATQLLVNHSMVVYYMTTNFMVDFPNANKKWLLHIGYLSLIYVMALILIVVILSLVQRFAFYDRWEKAFLFSTLEELWAKFTRFGAFLKRNRRYVLVFASFYLMTFAQLVLLHNGTGLARTIHKILLVLTSFESTMILTAIIMYAFFLLLFFIFNRFWPAVLIPVLIDLVLTVASLIKIPLRQEPILPADIKALSAFSELSGMVDPAVLIVGGIAIVLMIIGTIWLQHKWNFKLRPSRSWKSRLVGIATILVLFSGVFFVNHKDSPSYVVFNTFKVYKFFFDQVLAVKQNGAILQFAKNIDVTIMDKPAGYSEAKIDSIMKKYDQYTEQQNTKKNDWAKNQTVVFVLSESLSNPQRVPNTNISADLIPYITKLEKDNGGLMLSTGYGGGTANMEWQALTGLDISNLSATLSTPYNQLVDSQKITSGITDLFQSKIAIHPYTANLYNRKNVFKKLGFQKFYHIDSPDKLTYDSKIDNSPYISDQSAFDETIKHLKQTQDKTQFIQLSTMQNHMPFDNYYSHDDFQVSGQSTSDADKASLRNYAQGLSYTDQSTKEFIAKLDRINKPITVVFYGDHLPGLYSGNPMEKYGIDEHETDYFIYSNKYSREHNKAKDTAEKVVSPYSFPALALEQDNLKTTPFYTLLQRVTNELPASTNDPTTSVTNRFNGSKIFVNDKSQIVEEDNLTKKQKQILHDYQLIQYDLTAGQEYAGKWAAQTIK